MAEESDYSSPVEPQSSNKRKYDDETPPSEPPRKPTGFSSPILPPESSLPNSAADEIQLAKQKAQEIAARLMGGAVAPAPFDSKRPRLETNGYDSSPPNDGRGVGSAAVSNIPVSYGSYMGGGGGGGSKKIEIPQGRVGVIIGKGGETIKYLQNQSGAKIQVTRDMDSDPNSTTRAVELMGTPDQISRAEQLINDVLTEADAGGSGTISRRFNGQGGGSGSGVDHFVMKIPSNKVGLVIGKGGDTIKQMQARTHARIQVIPLHLPPGDSTTERNVHIDGTSDQIEAAKQLINEVISENRGRTSMGGGYSQQGYQSRPPSSWGGAHGGPPMPQSGYGYMQQSGPYSGQSQYNMSQPAYGGYPPQSTSGAYSSGWDQSTGSASHPPSQGYDYYGQPPSSQPQATPGGSAAPADNTSYNYGHPPASGYNQPGQGYSQDGYGGYPQTGYGQQPPYDQQGYASAPSYGNVPNPTQEAHATSYGAQGEAAQAPPPSSATGQQSYGAAQPPGSSAANYPPQGAQPGYGVPPTSQAGYGTQPPYGSSYGPPQAQKTPSNLPVYGQSQQSPSTTPGGYGQPAPVQSAYPPHSQPPTSYSQSDSSAQRAPPSGYGPPAGQPGYGTAPTYGAPPAGQPGYGQGSQPYNASYGSGYGQQNAMPSNGS